jgi:hypothetical protein
METIYYMVRNLDGDAWGARRIGEYGWVEVQFGHAYDDLLTAVAVAEQVGGVLDTVDRAMGRAS